MTDRLKGLTVAFEKDIRDDDAESIIQAIKMIKGVLEVKAVPFGNHSDWIERTRIRDELTAKLWKVLKDDRDYDQMGG
jgi:hypothetical protein